jgi:hypothetical protein
VNPRGRRELVEDDRKPRAKIAVAACRLLTGGNKRRSRHVAAHAVGRRRGYCGIRTTDSVVSMQQLLHPCNRMLERHHSAGLTIRSNPSGLSSAGLSGVTESTEVAVVRLSWCERAVRVARVPSPACDSVFRTARSGFGSERLCLLDRLVRDLRHATEASRLLGLRRSGYDGTFWVDQVGPAGWDRSPAAIRPGTGVLGKHLRGQSARKRRPGTAPSRPLGPRAMRWRESSCTV